jgi:Fur family transcriptional regulator, zinc uptake regulator
MSFLPPQHDHSHCSHDIVARAEKACAERGVRLTEQRRDVLALVAASHKAVGAYDIIEMMAARGARPAPITVYRALDFLLAQNLVHRIESRNSYVACAEQHDDLPTALLICDDCGSVSEVLERAPAEGLTAAAKAQGFAVKRAVVELSGTCGHCEVL